MCTWVVCVLHNSTQNNIEQKEKGIFKRDLNMVKCAKFDRSYIVFLFHNDYKIAESMLDLVCIYIYSFVKIGV